MDSPHSDEVLEPTDMSDSVSQPHHSLDSSPSRESSPQWSASSSREMSPDQESVKDSGVEPKQRTRRQRSSVTNGTQKKPADEQPKRPGRKRGPPKKEVPASVEAKVPSNWQRKPHGTDKTGPFDFVGAKVDEEMLSVTLADNTTISNGDHVYVLAEPVGEPYYIGRVMEFIAVEKPTKPDSDDLADRYMVRLNWLYRPVDLHKKSVNTREVFATMHSDPCPLQSLRGRCTVRSSQLIPDLDKYMDTPSSFWFDRLWDRYIERFFDVIPTESITNLPLMIQPLLKERFKFVVTEPTKTKELTRPAKSCVTCEQWATDDDSVQCVRCDNFYHMACLNPPLNRKLARGFGWSCAPCNLAMENAFVYPSLEHKRRRKPRINPDENKIAGSSPPNSQESAEPASSPAHGDENDSEATEEEEEADRESSAPVPEYRHLEDTARKQVTELTPVQKRQALLWPIRYLGIHARIEDIFDHDDRIHPRAASRIGVKHQASVNDWPGRPVAYYKTIRPERRKRGPKGRNTASVEAKYEPSDLDRSLPWVQEMPVGYIERGGDTTSTLCWSMDTAGTSSDAVDDFLKKTVAYATQLGIKQSSTNFIDACLDAFMDAEGDEAAALKVVSTFTRKYVKEPTFTAEEVQRFEEGVALYGNELHLVYKHVGTKSSADVVRFYYMWKKTEAGHEIWDKNQNRASRRKATKVQDTFGHSIADDNAPVTGYSADKVKKLKKTLVCKNCSTNTSREWRKAPGPPPTSESNPIEALCIRCARIWYRYAVAWESPEEVMRMMALKGNQKIKIEPELLEDSRAILAEREKYTATGRKRAKTEGVVKRKPRASQSKDEETTPKKTTRRGRRADLEVKLEENDVSDESTDDSGTDQDIKSVTVEGAEPETSQQDPLSPEQSGDVVPEGSQELGNGHGADLSTAESPESATDNDNSAKTISEQYGDMVKRIYSEQRSATEDIKRVVDPANYCAVCCQLDPSYPQLNCHSCGMCVHIACYGWSKLPEDSSIWYCDTCQNDKEQKAEYLYHCELCPVKLANYPAWLTGELTNTPDVVKRTFDRRWAHVRCAIWTPQVTFGNPKLLQPIDQVYKVPRANFEKMCYICSRSNGACVNCDECSRQFHIGCAGNEGYHFGFLLEPTADSDQKTVSFRGLTGQLRPVIRCLDHNNEGMIPMSEMDEEKKLTCLQLYCQTYKGTTEHATGAMKLALRHTLDQTNEDYIRPIVIPTDLKLKEPLDVKDFSPLSSKDVSCGRCDTKDSGYWLDVKTEDTGYILCTRCYAALKNSDAFVKQGGFLNLPTTSYIFNNLPKMVESIDVVKNLANERIPELPPSSHQGVPSAPTGPVPPVAAHPAVPAPVPAPPTGEAIQLQNLPNAPVLSEHSTPQPVSAVSTPQPLSQGASQNLPVDDPSRSSEEAQNSQKRALKIRDLLA